MVEAYNFGIKGIPDVREESALELGGSRLVNAEKLSRAWLNAQNEMVEPLANLLDELVSSGKLDKEVLANTIHRANRPFASYARTDQAAETQVTRAVSARFLALLAVRLSGGNAQEAQGMLGMSPGGALAPDVESLAQFVTQEARHPVKKR